MEVGSSGVCARAPPCYWSPIPPPELRGESMTDLSTNGGFVSFGTNHTRHSHFQLYNITVHEHISQEIFGCSLQKYSHDILKARD